jgi:hypothetical protein
LRDLDLGLGGIAFGGELAVVQGGQLLSPAHRLAHINEQLRYHPGALGGDIYLVLYQ